MKIKALLTIILFLCVVSTLTAQTSKSNSKANSESGFIEYIANPSIDTLDTNTVFFFYKIRLNELVFDKSDNIKMNSFSAFPTFEIEIKDTAGIIRKRLTKKDTITIEDYSLLSKNDQYYEGLFTTKLSNLDYTVHYQVTSNNRNLYDKRFDLNISKDNKLKVIRNPILGNMTVGNKLTFIPSVFKSTIDIKSTKPTILAFVTPSDKRNLIATISYVQESAIPPKDYPLSANAKIVYLDNQGIDFAKNNDIIQGSITPNINSTIYQIEIPQNMLYPGKFVLTLVDRSKKDTLNYNYKVQWIDTPISLANTDYTQEIMYYIMSDEEFAKLKSIKSKDKENYIYQYWKKFDPTPTTFYNEAMNAYFKRADEAKSKFLTILHSDGAKTSRGQIYILNGNPDSIVNELKEKKPVERWEYKALKKQFIFEITTPGEYKLTRIIE